LFVDAIIVLSLIYTSDNNSLTIRDSTMISRKKNSYV